MSGPIRHIGGATPTPPVADAGRSEPVVSETFATRLEAARRVESSPTEAVRSVGVEPAALAAALRSGAIQPAEAVEALVTRALASPIARGLSETARADLERMLRAALVEDPALVALGADLGRR